MAGGTIKTTTWKLLWTNPDDTATFAPQTVSLDLSAYSEFLISFRIYSTNSVFYTQAYYYKDRTTAALTQYSAKFTRRSATIRNTGVEFLSGGQDPSYGAQGMTVDNNYMLPSSILAK